MVKLTGPALSTAASGQLAGALIFSSNKGRAYVKKHTKPKQPRTGKQVSMRAMMRFLSENWSQISADRQATWTTLATQANLSPFNAYQRYNLNRWRNLLPPSQMFPAAEVLEPAHDTVLDAIGSFRKVLLSLQYHFEVRDNWCCFIFATPGSYPPASFPYLVHIVRYLGPPDRWWTHRNLAAGIWGYRIVYTSQDGKHDWANSDTDSAVVT